MPKSHGKCKYLLIYLFIFLLFVVKIQESSKFVLHVMNVSAYYDGLTQETEVLRTREESTVRPLDTLQ